MARNERTSRKVASKAAKLLADMEALGDHMSL